jgi:hypothetical protein
MCIVGPAVTIVFFALWVPVAVIASLVVARLAWKESGTPVVAVLAAVIAAAGLIGFPRAVRSTASTARTNRSFDIAQSRRPDNPKVCLVQFKTCVNERVWDELRQRIPPHATYYMQSGSALISFYTFTSLFPRIATTNRHLADWVISYHHDPRSLGLKLARVWTLGPMSRAKRELLLAKVKS